MDEKRETPEEQKKRKKRISAEENAWLKKTLSPYRGGIFFLAVLTVSGSVLSVAFSYLVRYLVDGASSGSRRTLPSGKRRQRSSPSAVAGSQRTPMRTWHVPSAS